MQVIAEIFLDRTYNRTWKFARSLNGGEYAAYSPDNELSVLPQNWKVNCIFATSVFKFARKFVNAESDPQIGEKENTCRSDFA